jgi:hypothetical protein
LKGHAARKILTVRNKGLSGKRGSIAVRFISSRGSLFGTSAIREDTSIDSLGCAVDTNIVDLGVFTVVFVIFVPVSIQSFTFSKLVHVDLILLVLVLSAVSKAYNSMNIRKR